LDTNIKLFLHYISHCLMPSTRTHPLGW
jgi:hypothetical protein